MAMTPQHDAEGFHHHHLFGEGQQADGDTTYHLSRHGRQQGG
jgi:hypothetical protein